MTCNDNDVTALNYAYMENSVHDINIILTKGFSGLTDRALLICHSNLGTKHKSHQRLITISHENGVIGLQNE